MIDPDTTAEPTGSIKKVSLSNLIVNNYTFHLGETFDLGRGSEITANFSFSHSLHVMLFRWLDVRSCFETKCTLSEDSTNVSSCPFSKELGSKAIFHKVMRGGDVTWTVPESTRYAVVLGNDSPFFVDVKRMKVKANIAVPILSNPLVSIDAQNCQSDYCEMKLPDNFTKDHVSIVVWDPANPSERDYVSFDSSTSGIIVLFSTYMWIIYSSILSCMVEGCMVCPYAIEKLEKRWN